MRSQALWWSFAAFIVLAPAASAQPSVGSVDPEGDVRLTSYGSYGLGPLNWPTGDYAPLDILNVWILDSGDFIDFGMQTATMEHASGDTTSQFDRKLRVSFQVGTVEYLLRDEDYDGCPVVFERRDGESWTDLGCGESGDDLSNSSTTMRLEKSKLLDGDARPPSHESPIGYGRFETHSGEIIIGDSYRHEMRDHAPDEGTLEPLVPASPIPRATSGPTPTAGTANALEARQTDERNATPGLGSSAALVTLVIGCLTRRARLA